MSSLQFPGNTIVYFRQNNQNVQYSTDQSSWTTATFPISIGNTNTSLGTLKVYFNTNITLTNASDKFLCSTAQIQFGNTTLKEDGTRPTITVTADNFQGLIQNGEAFTSGNANIYIYNLIVDGTGYSTNANSGWFGQAYFGKGAANNFIINCSSLGGIGTDGGGIVGSSAAANSGSLSIIACSSSGTIGTSAGGIVGRQSGETAGTVTCTQCYSTGAISGDSAGGIFAAYAGDNSGTATATKCYSSGTIGANAGGIFGSNAGNNSGTATASNCYSTAQISSTGGGIFGQNGATSGGSATATNCYTSGATQGEGNGIFARSTETVTTERCYAANGSWSSSTANSSLNGTPVSPSVIGTSWVNVTTNQPYEINNIGFTPYTRTIINSTPTVIQTFSLTKTAGESTSAAIKSGQSYSILSKSGGNEGSYSTITINSTTGVIATTAETVAGVYTLVIRNTGSYNITQFVLTVNAIPTPTPLVQGVSWALVGTIIGVCVFIMFMHFQRMAILRLNNFR
jgi:hypothetical protein